MAAQPDTAITYTIATTTLGRLLLAATRRGICLVRFGASEAALRAELARTFPYANPTRDDAGLADWCRALVDAVEGRSDRIDLPLDVRGSRFQRRVWQALVRIPRGRTRAYGEVARGLGMPRGARAVARACASNPLAVVIPCHRVVARDGLGGYAFGLDRKRALLQREAGHAPAARSGPARTRRAPEPCRPAPASAGERLGRAR